MSKGRQEYRTVRIYPEDAEVLRRLSYRTGKPMVRLISEARELLEEDIKKKKAEDPRSIYR